MAVFRDRKQLAVRLYFWRMRLAGGRVWGEIAFCHVRWMSYRKWSLSQQLGASQWVSSEFILSLITGITGSYDGHSSWWGPSLLCCCDIRLCPHDVNHSLTCPGGKRFTELSSCFHVVISKFFQDWLVFLNFSPDTTETSVTLFPENEVWD